MDRGDYDLALSCINKAVEKAPDLAEPHLVRSRVYRLKTRYADAVLDATEAIRLDPKLADAYVSRAHCYLALDVNGWEEDMRDAIGLQPKNAFYYRSLGDMLASMRRDPRPEYRQSLKLETNPKVREEIESKIAVAEKAIHPKPRPSDPGPLQPTSPFDALPPMKKLE